MKDKTKMVVYQCEISGCMATFAVDEDTARDVDLHYPACGEEEFRELGEMSAEWKVNV